MAALANDEAFIHYHQGDAAACLKSLTGIPDGAAGTAFNRALCGGTCSLDAAKCGKAAEARTKGIAARTLQKKLRERTQAWCSNHRGPTGLPGWYLPDQPGWALAPEESETIIWTGDLNGDGLGDLISAWSGYWQDTSSAALDGRLPRGAHTVVRWRSYRVSIGCPKVGQFAEVFGRNSEYDTNSADHPDEPDNDIVIRVLDRPRTAMRSVCIYSGRNLKCTASKCNREPDECADLSEWEKIESASRAQP